MNGRDQAHTDSGVQSCHLQKTVQSANCQIYYFFRVIIFPSCSLGIQERDLGAAMYLKLEAKFVESPWDTFKKVWKNTILLAFSTSHLRAVWGKMRHLGSDHKVSTRKKWRKFH